MSSEKRARAPAAPTEPVPKSKVRKCAGNDGIGATALKVYGHGITVNVSHDALTVTTRHEHTFERAGKTIHIRTVVHNSGNVISGSVIVFGGGVVTLGGTRIEPGRPTITMAVPKTKRYTLYDADRIQTAHASNSAHIVWARPLGVADSMHVRLSNSASMKVTGAQTAKIAHLKLDLTNSACFHCDDTLECDSLTIDASNSARVRGIRANHELEVDVSNSACVDVASAPGLTSKYIWVMNDARCVVNGKDHKI